MRPVRHGGENNDQKAVRSKVRRRTDCGKQGYTSKKLAKATAKAQSRFTGETIHPYHCFGCHCWHIGHPPRPFDFDADRAQSRAS